MTAHFHFLEDIAIADTAFEASGDTPSELFLAAAQAVFETMADPATVSGTWTHTIEYQEEDVAALLFDWLNEIVYLKDAQGVVFREASARVEQDPATGQWLLQGTLLGDPIDQTRQELRADVKAVTKHLYEVRQDGPRWTARVVLDI